MCVVGECVNEVESLGTRYARWGGGRWGDVAASHSSEKMPSELVLLDLELSRADVFRSPSGRTTLTRRSQRGRERPASFTRDSFCRRSVRNTAALARAYFLDLRYASMVSASETSKGSGPWFCSPTHALRQNLHRTGKPRTTNPTYADNLNPAPSHPELRIPNTEP